MSECMMRKAPPSSHSKEVWPCRVVPGKYPCVPIVLHVPIKTPNDLSAGFGFAAGEALMYEF